MSLLDKESLFSLELVAESLSLSQDIACRFPAVAFRLLDFPTLIIYHVEPDLGLSIKKKLNTDPLCNLPPQLRELHNKDGHFFMRKGKSCLFKVAPNVLLCHLQNTPMYVMVIDTYPSAPKLVGNCTVPLDKTMLNLYADIKTNGLSVPSSHGEKGSFKIFNLMGDEIGKVSFGFRLLSLGMGLISHIPDKSVARIKSKPETMVDVIKPMSVQACQNVMEKEATEMILGDLETADQNIQVVLSTPRPAKSMIETQTDLGPQRVVATQTDELLKKKLRKEKAKCKKYDSLNTMAQDIVVDDIIITNMFCPPSLFYNSKADPPQIAPGLTFDDYIVHKKRETQGQAESDSSYDSDSTIRQEDRFSESEYDVKPVVKTVDDYKEVEKKPKPKKKVNKPEFNFDSMANFPLLSALMSEIVALQGVPPKNVQSQSPQKGAAFQRSEQSLTPRTPRHSRPPSGRQIKTPEKKKPSIAEYRTQFKEVIKNKGWLNKPIKKDPVPKATSSAISMAEKKTKIMPGMTNTQRLRLAKTNPQLLMKLEKEEQHRVSQFKARRRDLGEGFDTPQLDVSTQITKYPADTSQYESFARKIPLKHTHESPKRPIPTPRSSVKEDHITVREVPFIVPRQEHQNLLISEESANVQQQANNGFQSTRSHIDVHMPAIPTALDESTSDYEVNQPQLQTKPRDDLFGKTYNNPGFPNNVTVQSTGEISVQYSEDFEDTNEINDIRVSEVIERRNEAPVDVEEALGLKRMDDTYTDDDSLDGGVPSGALGLRHTINTYHSGYEQNGNDETGIDAGEFLGLKQVVDKYSEDDNEYLSNEGTRSSYSLKSEHYSEEQETKPKLKIATSLVRTVAPSTSEQSPLVSTKQPTMSLRRPVTASSSTLEDQSPDSTAYINRSDVTSQFSSLESMGQAGLKFNQRSTSPKKPFISPRKSLERIRTESVSSYAPSDGDMEEYGSQIIPLTPTQEYSDQFETAESEDESLSVHVKQMKDAEVAPEARFGYTWSGKS